MKRIEGMRSRQYIKLGDKGRWRRRSLSSLFWLCVSIRIGTSDLGNDNAPNSTPPAGEQDPPTKLSSQFSSPALPQARALRSPTNSPKGSYLGVLFLPDYFV